MSFDPVIAACRFGCGLSPDVPAPRSVPEMLALLTGPDHTAREFPIETFPEFRQRLFERQELGKNLRKIRNTPEGEKRTKQIRRMKGAARRASVGWFHQHLMRRTWTEDGFRERITAFWADHFTTRGRAGIIKRGASPYVESAIRPRVAGFFEDMLIEAVTHPMMVDYLDQRNSRGDNSISTTNMRAKGKKAGINENLAREVLELHTLGVDGPYTQKDVAELADLLAGVSFRIDQGRVYFRHFAEPGAETILGKTYGGDPPEFSHVEEVLRDLARHPATARHIARKLAVHFFADAPPDDLVAAIEAAYLESGGHLTQVYHAMLSHPAAWAPERRNVKPPFEFMGSAMRALAMPPEALANLKERQSRSLLIAPLRAMGHAWETPTGPDGLYEADADWITPQALALRVQWAMRAPERFLGALPDPRTFVETALGPEAPEPVRFAAKAAESVPEAIGLVLISPAFQRV
ncbi:DUF1800 domain-containing protein [Roseobacteraceae bacterium S113]